MKFFERYLPVPAWYDASDSQTGSLPRTLIVPKACYNEHRRVYKASFTEAWKLLRNERAVFQAGEHQVVWQWTKLPDGRIEVLYAVINASLSRQLRRGLTLLIPETWLLRHLIASDTLYQVEGDDPYWAWLDQDQLHTTPIRGLMKQQQFFLDAIGRRSKEQTPQSIEPRKQAIQLRQLPFTQLAGLLVMVSPPRQTQQALPWGRIATSAGLVFLAYATVLSGMLTFTEKRLQAQVQTLQGKANQLFTEQERQSRRRDVLLAYQQEFERLPAVSKVSALVIEVLSEKAQLQRLEISGAQIQVRGSAESSTEILALLSEQPYWNEVRFDENVRRTGSGEEFVISMVLRAGVIYD